ncbi:MAG: squalene--hopene cyclase [Hyphomicrobium sp.]
MTTIPSFNHYFFDRSQLDEKINHSLSSLLKLQKNDGHFVFELEADCTIPSEYVLLCYFRGETLDPILLKKISTYIKKNQGKDGGWPLFYDGQSNISASVKAYFALKVIGEQITSEQMTKARSWILSKGGASQSNVFTRNLLALFKLIPWSAVPIMPVEILLLPRWFPFHIEKISYWARTVLVPLTVLNALKPQPRYSNKISVNELFLIPPEHEKNWAKGPIQIFPWTFVFGILDKCLRIIEPYFPKSLRENAIRKAVSFVTERINGEDGLGAIFPAMLNSVLMYDALGHSCDSELLSRARLSIDKLLIVNDYEAYCQPCLSPVWDTALVAHTLMEVGTQEAMNSALQSTDWLKLKQVLDVKGDWASNSPNTRPGGWAFQYSNPHYPDVDDTAVVAMAMDRIINKFQSKEPEYAECLNRASEWILGMQSRNGGWGAFDVNNEYYYLNNIPFADHGALLDPPTADVSARCLSMLAQLGAKKRNANAISKAISYLKNTQEKDGSWYGRWGMNYIYGTWSVLSALNAAEVECSDPSILKAIDWLVSIQNDDGGWGEGGESYKLDYKGYEKAPSTASQTAWALLGLMAAGAIDNSNVKRGISYLINNQEENGFWKEPQYTATGFPRVFYLKYHGYSKLFPLWALARYKNLSCANTSTFVYGI